MRMVAALDAGPVYASRSTPIGAAETAGELEERLAALGAELLVERLPALLSGDARAVGQDEALVTYAPKIDKADAVLDWRSSARELERRVRAFNPWPVAETRFAEGGRLRIWGAELAGIAGTHGPPGTILAAGARGIDVAAGRGVLRLTSVQPPSSRRMDAAAYLAAHDVRDRRFE